MSRTKHKVTKHMAGLPLHDQARLARHGDRNQSHVAAAHIIHRAAQLEPPPPLPIKAEHVKTPRDAAWLVISREILNAFKKRDGTFFRGIADAVEGPVDPIREWVADELDVIEHFQDRPMPTIREIQKQLLGLGFPKDQISYRQLLRIFTEMGRVPSPGKPGRPPS